jgi:hypothetical protein
MSVRDLLSAAIGYRLITSPHKMELLKSLRYEHFKCRYG